MQWSLHMHLFRLAPHCKTSMAAVDSTLCVVDSILCIVIARECVSVWIHEHIFCCYVSYIFCCYVNYLDCTYLYRIHWACTVYNNTSLSPMNTWEWGWCDAMHTHSKHITHNTHKNTHPSLQQCQQLQCLCCIIPPVALAANVKMLEQPVASPLAKGLGTLTWRSAIALH